MIFKGSIRESIEENGGPSKKTGHSEKVYHRFFEGYTARVVPRANGKGCKVRYEYTGEYYKQQLSDRQRLGVKCLYVLLYVLICVGFVLASIAPVEGNLVWYVGLPQAMCVLGLGWMLIVLLHYVPAPKLLTIYLRRTIIGFHFRGASTCMVVMFAWLSLASVVWLVLHRGDVGLVELGCSLTYVLCTLLSLTILRTEKNIQYLEIENC